MRRLPVVPSAIACVLLVAALADRTAPAASVPEVLIGDVLPLTGNFASLGQQYLWAGQTVEDIINNDYADLAVPLGPGKGIASLFSFLTEWPGHGGPKDLKTVAVFTCDNLFCQDNRKIANELLPKLGFQIVLDLTTKTGATTLASEVQRLQAANPDILFLVQYPPETSIFQGDAKRAAFTPKVIATSNGAYSDQTWLEAQKKTNGGAGWIGRDPTAIDLVHDRPSWKKGNEIYRKYSRGQNIGELAMREITGLLWMADTINRAKSVEPAALAKAAMETDTPPEQLIIDYKGIRFDKNHQNELATGVVTQIGWDGEKHTVWPWELAKRAGFKVLHPNPGWQDRESKPKPAS